MKSKYLIGQSEEQRKNGGEQRKRRDDIKKKFPCTITYHTYSDLAEIIKDKQSKLTRVFDKLGVKYRNVELRSLVISYYIRSNENPEIKDIARFIYLNLIKEEKPLKEVLLKLNNEYQEYKWTENSLKEFFLFKGERK